MKLKMDFPILLGGVRTAAALLIGNSALIYTGVIGGGLQNAIEVAAKIFIVGVIVLVCTSLKGES